MSIDFNSQNYVRDIEEAALAGGWTIQYLSPCTSGTRPWLQRDAQTGSNAPRIYLSTGIHGDEISGMAALLDMLREPDFFAGFHTIIFPILNPNGLALGTRNNADDIDLNRDYRSLKSAEIQSHVETLKTLGRFDAAMMLHEDFEGIGAYLYELNETPLSTLGNKIIAAMGRHVPVDLRPEIEELPARDGIIQRKDIILKRGPIEERLEWPEALYLSVHHTHVSYTTETPTPFPLEQRVAAQIAAVKALLKTLTVV